MKIERNQIYHMNCLDGMKLIENESIQCIVTSPPYDDLREYENKTSLHEVGKEAFRILEDGGIFALNIQDKTIDGGKTLTSFRTVMNFVDDSGFKLFETIIWKKQGRPGAWWNKRFRLDHEYIFLFVKGKRPKFFDKEPLKIDAIHKGKTAISRDKENDGTMRERHAFVQKDKKCRGTIWEMDTTRRKKNIHPAMFPEQLPKDIIQCFTQEGDTVLDMFSGSGTTCFVAKNLNRRFIGFEIDKTFHEDSLKRLEG